MVRSWHTWKDSLVLLENVAVPRMYFKESMSNLDWVQLHVFSDASESAVSAVAYLRTSCNGNIEVSFAMGKAKLAPSKGHTIPRLELCAALLATEAGEFVRENLQTDLMEIRYYTDSKVVLGYLSNKTRRFYNYVSNRVERILLVTEPRQWFYVSTHNNPADHGTRGLVSVEDLQRKWLIGPSFLFDPELDSTQTYPLVSPEADKEIRVEAKKTSCLPEQNFISTFDRFSDWHRLIGAIAIIKGLSRGLKREKGSAVPDHATLRKESQDCLIRLTQQHAYVDEIGSLHSKTTVSRASPLSRLSPFLDESGILRVGGRLSQSSLPVEQCHPIILPGKSHLTRLLISHIHDKVQHQGRLITEGALRNHGYWVVGAKRAVSSLIHGCVVCRKLRGSLEYQKMADLPSDRVQPGPPFMSVGVDAFGPWLITSRKTRGGMAHNKRWALMFTCLTTRAVHIEVVEDMTSSSVINAIRRLVALRGEVQEFRSDRGTNFVGAADEMKANVVNIEDGPFQRHLNRSGMTWIFNAPHSSHMGGVWERMIGVARRILDSMFLRQTNQLTHEVLVTFMAEVCAIINSRPITAISYDSDSPMILSPSLLLTQRVRGNPTMCEGLDIKDIYKAQWRHVQVLANTFWKQWKGQFLQALQSRRKWTDERPNIKTGDVVLLKDSSVPRFQWPVGIVHRVFPSDHDNHVRKVQIRIIRDGKPIVLTRPISQLVLLID